MVVTPAEFHLVPAVNPCHRAGNIDGIFVSIARTGNRIAYGCITADLYERWPNRGVQRRLILKTQARRGGVIDGLVEEILVPQKRETRHPDERWQKRVRFLRHKVLGPLVFSNREAWHIRTGRGEWVNRIPLRKHVAEIQNVLRGQVMVYSHSKLVIVLIQRLRGAESIWPQARLIGQREKGQ